MSAGAAAGKIGHCSCEDLGVGGVCKRWWTGELLLEMRLDYRSSSGEDMGLFELVCW